MSRRTLPLLVWGALLLLPPLAAAQEVPVADLPEYDPPAHLSVVDGAATLGRESRSEPAVVNMPLLEGDRLETGRGRVEVVFADGSVLHLDEFSTLDLLSGNLLRLLRGRVIVLAAGDRQTRSDLDFQVDTPAGSIRILMPGQYRISLFSGPEVELAVVRGEAALATSRASSQARTGERVYAREGEAPSYPMAFNSARWDAFEVWSDEQRRATLGDTSAQYLPDEVDRYAYMFDRYGSWREVADYGRVWYPTVAVDWRPYYHGYWRPFSTLGWFWIGYDPWGWPTHHYGRWGFDGGWYWIPQRRFGSAWVSWGISAHHVSWCPLGWDNRPIFSLFADNDYYRGRSYDPWRAWTVVPRHAFGGSARMSTVAVSGATLDYAVRRSFIVQQAAPPASMAARARPIGAAGLRAADAGRAVPRGSPGGLTGGGGGPAGQAPGASMRPSAPAPSAVPRGGAPARSAEPGAVWRTPSNRGSGDQGAAGRVGSGVPSATDRGSEARSRFGSGTAAPGPTGGGGAAVRERDYWPDRRTPRASPGSTSGAGGGTSVIGRPSSPADGANTQGRAPGTTYGSPRTPGATSAQPRYRAPSGAGRGSTYSAPAPRAYERAAPRSSTPLPRASERTWGGSPSAAPRSSSQPRTRPESSAPRASQPSWTRPQSSAPRASQPVFTPRASPAAPRGGARGMTSRPSASPSIRSAPSNPSRGQSPSRSASGSPGGGGSRARPRK